MLLTRKDIPSQAQSPKVGHKQLGDSIRWKSKPFLQGQGQLTDGDGCFEEYKTIKVFGNEKYDRQSFKTIKHTKSKSKTDKAA